MKKYIIILFLALVSASCSKEEAKLPDMPLDNEFKINNNESQAINYAAYYIDGNNVVILLYDVGTAPQKGLSVEAKLDDVSTSVGAQWTFPHLPYSEGMYVEIFTSKNTYNISVDGDMVAKMGWLTVVGNPVLGDCRVMMTVLLNDNTTFSLHWRGHLTVVE